MTARDEAVLREICEELLDKHHGRQAPGGADAVAWQTVSDFVDEMLRDWSGGDDCRMGFGLNGATVTKGQFRAVQAALASLSPAATPVSEARGDMIPRAKNVGRYLAETNDGRLLYLNHATEWHEMPNILAKPASSPAGTASPLRRVRHVRRGSEYEVLGEAEGQVSVRGAVILEEGDRVVVYRGADGRLWWRVPEEFSDGRFVDI